MSKFRPTRRGVLRGVAAVAAAMAVSAGSLIGTAPIASAAENAGGLTVTESKLDDPRMKFYRFDTAEIGWDPGVHVLLPAGYDPGRRYPVLYLYHGGGPGQDFMAWDKFGIRRAPAADMIIVMPDGGMAGWYTNPKTSNTGPRNWENFHIEQLIPWVDANFSTYDDAAGRAVAGFSMGGFGALKYMAAHPDLFSSVSSHSGPADLRFLAGEFGHYVNATSAIAELAAGTAYGVPWDEKKVSSENPAENIESFRGKRVFMAAGNGPFQDLRNVAGDIGEVEVLPNQKSFSAQLTKAGIQHDRLEQPKGHTVDKELFLKDFAGIVEHLKKAG